MSFSRPFQWYHSEADPILPDGTFKLSLVLSFHFHTFVPFSVFHICPASFHSPICPISFKISQHPVFFHLHLSRFLSFTYQSYFPPLLLSTFLSFDLSYYFHFDFVPFPFTLLICPVSFHSTKMSRFLSLSPFVLLPFTLPKCLVSFHSPQVSRFLSLSPSVSFPFTLLICSLSFHFYSIGRCECLQKRRTET